MISLVNWMTIIFQIRHIWIPLWTNNQTSTLGLCSPRWILRKIHFRWVCFVYWTKIGDGACQRLNQSLRIIRKRIWTGKKVQFSQSKHKSYRMDMPRSRQLCSQDFVVQKQMYQCCIFCNHLVPFHPDKNPLWRYHRTWIRFCRWIVWAFKGESTITMNYQNYGLFLIHLW